MNIRNWLTAVFSFPVLLVACGSDSPAEKPDPGTGGEQVTDVSIYVTTNNRSMDLRKKVLGLAKNQTCRPLQ